MGLDPRTQEELATLLNDLAHDKETRGVVGRAIRKKYPNSAHAEAFKDLEIEDKFEAMERERKDTEYKRQQEVLIERMNAQRANLLNGGPDGSGPKYDEDSLKKIEALMEKKGITDYEDGATLYAATQPPITKPNDKPPVSGTTWEFPAFERYSKDPVRASREVAAEVIQELQRRRA